MRVDFTGTLDINGEDGHITRTFLILFTYAIIRAIHLELLPDLTSQSFMSAIKQIASRQGLPQPLLSYNVTTFVTAANYINEPLQDPPVNDCLISINYEGKKYPSLSSLVLCCMGKIDTYRKLKDWFKEGAWQSFSYFWWAACCHIIIISYNKWLPLNLCKQWSQWGRCHHPFLIVVERKETFPINIH